MQVGSQANQRQRKNKKRKQLNPTPAAHKWRELH
jgi:hypothetical protein